MVSDGESILERFATEAIREGADMVEVEYKDGYEEVAAFWGHVGCGIGRLPASGEEGMELRRTLYGMRKRKHRMVVENATFELRVQIYDSFGEDAFHVHLRRVEPGRRSGTAVPLRRR